MPSDPPSAIALIVAASLVTAGAAAYALRRRDKARWREFKREADRRHKAMMADIRDYRLSQLRRRSHTDPE